MANGKTISLDEANSLIGSYCDEMKPLILASKLLKKFPKNLLSLVGKKNAFLIDASEFHKLKDAKHIIVFFAKNQDNNPTIVIANCNEVKNGYKVPDNMIAAIEHVPLKLVPSLELGANGEDSLYFAAK